MPLSTRNQNRMIKVTSTLALVAAIGTVATPLVRSAHHTLSNPYRGDPAIGQYESMGKILGELQRDRSRLEYPRRIEIQGNAEENIADLELAYGVPLEKIASFDRLIERQESGMSDFYTANPVIKNNKNWQARNNEILEDSIGTYFVAGTAAGFVGLVGLFFSAVRGFRSVSEENEAVSEA